MDGGTEHISTIAKRGGYSFGSQRGRNGPVNVILNGIEADISGYLDFPGDGMCFEVRQRVDKSKVVIATSSDCHIKPLLELTVEEGGRGRWVVTEARAVPTAK